MAAEILDTSAAITEKLVDTIVWQDYCVLGLVLAISTGIGLYFLYEDKKKALLGDVENYLLAGRSLDALPVALSLTSSFMSAITVLGTPVEYYMYGSMFLWCGLGYIFVAILVAEVFIPVLYDLKVTTSYEYFRLRFNSPILELTSSCMFIFVTLAYCGIVVYAPALALQQLTKINLWVAASLTALLCTFYTTLGGLKAVVWTDVFQCGMIMSGFVSIIVVGCMDFGGFGNMLEISKQNGRIILDDFSLDPRVRYSVWSILFGCTFGIWGGLYGTNQSMVQRYISCKSTSTAKRAIYYNAIGLNIILVLALSTGVSAFAYFHKCDPIDIKWVAKSDQIIPYLSTYVLKGAPGLTGLYMAGVYAGTLSTVSSGINSVSAVLMTSFMDPLIKKGSIKSSMAPALSKVIVFVSGVACLGVAYLASFGGSVLPFAMGLLGTLSGPVMGTFLLGLTIPSADNMTALIAFSVSTVIALQTLVGAKFGTMLSDTYANPDTETMLKQLNRTIDGCMNVTNVDSFDISPPLNSTTAEPTYDSWGEVYHISYLYYGVVGTFSAYIVGVITALIRRQLKCPTESYDPRTLHQLVRSKYTGQTPQKTEKFAMGDDIQ